ncbi:MAG TPA: OmpA family protein [Gemmatimonadaceae bacterium]|nr:OmpA family protein [Gemmatimonadaceae bacterium]
MPLDRDVVVRVLVEDRRDLLDVVRRAAEEANAKLNDALTQLRSLVAEITNIRETSRGLVISLSDILFDVNQATLKAGAAQNVQKIAAILNQYPDYNISVEGHTDASGSDAYNQDLSERRAASVREALVAGGVAASRISSKGFGESQPVASNDTPSGRQQNRRVEVIVLGAGKVADAVRTGQDTTAKRDSTSRPR